MLGAVAAIDEELADACGTDPSWLCDVVFGVSDSRGAARFVDGIVTPLLTALIVLVVAALLNRWLRRLVTTVISQVTRKDRAPGAALGKLVTGPTALTYNDAERDRVRATTLSAVARTTVSALIWTSATLTILGIFSINLGPLLASAGIAGIAVGLGAQSLVRDCIAGFFILLEDQCGVGDEIDVGPAIGTVESITLRSTTLRDATGTLWTVPNGTVLRIGNRSRDWAEANVDITVTKAGDLDAALPVIEGVAAEVSGREGIATALLQPIAVLGIEALETAGTTVRLSVRTRPGDQAQVMRTLRAALRGELERAGIATQSG